MNSYTSTKLGQKKFKRLLVGILLLSWLVLGSAGIGVASERHALLQIQGDRITGVLSQVSLRTVLEQFREKLAIEYVVPREELDKPVSAYLADEPVSKALSKILASWDYAWQLDQQGRVQQIFVVAKNGTIEYEKNPVKTSESKIAALPKNMTKSEPILGTSKMQGFPPGIEMPSNAERDAMVSLASEELPPMGIQPAQGSLMNIQSSSSFMQVIPASGYPPMDILPVSEDAQREFMEGHN